MTPPISNNKQTTKTEITKANDGLRPAHQPKKPVTHAILNILIKLKNNAKSDHTIKFVDKALTYLSKHADLNEPEQVKQLIANLQTSDSYKKNLCFAYNVYCKYYKIVWEMPEYRQEPKTIRIQALTPEIRLIDQYTGKLLGLSKKEIETVQTLVQSLIERRTSRIREAKPEMIVGKETPRIKAPSERRKISKADTLSYPLDKWT
ncbi:MAG: hypothetical protein OEZ25_06645 [Candidatus Bathyarchaeota archaeon]|nr:hypothetical protein [Candidatus Bathyarchaeota archaeon]